MSLKQSDIRNFFPVKTDCGRGKCTPKFASSYGSGSKLRFDSTAITELRHLLVDAYVTCVLMWDIERAMGSRESWIAWGLMLVKAECDVELFNSRHEENLLNESSILEPLSKRERYDSSPQYINALKVLYLNTFSQCALPKPPDFDLELSDEMGCSSNADNYRCVAYRNWRMMSSILLECVESYKNGQEFYFPDFHLLEHVLFPPTPIPQLTSINSLKRRFDEVEDEDEEAEFDEKCIFARVEEKYENENEEECIKCYQTFICDSDYLGCHPKCSSCRSEKSYGGSYHNEDYGYFGSSGDYTDVWGNQFRL